MRAGTARAKAEGVPLVAGAADKWREVFSSVENLSEHAKPDETEAARLALQEIIGEVSVVEQGARVLAYAKLNTAVVLKWCRERGSRFIP